MEFGLMIFVLVIVGGWVYGDARDRESSSPALWAIAVMAMMIIFLPAYFIFRPSKKATKVIATNPVSLCPHCGKYYDSQPKFCPNCGHSLSETGGLTGTDDSKPQ